MIDLKKKFINKELLVRKRICGFLEKILWYCGYDLSHNTYKSLFYSEKECETIHETKAKNYYDAYIYLLNNFQNPLSSDILDKFFYIVRGKRTNQSILIELSTKYFYLNDLSPIEKAVDFHMFVYERLKSLSKKERLLLSLMFLSYSLLKDGIPVFQIGKSSFQDYNTKRKEFAKGNKSSLYLLFMDIILNSKYQERDYYQNLSDLSTKDIYKIFNDDKELLIEKYGIKHMYLYGSFALNKERFDSDIDLFVNFNLDMTREQKLESIELLSNIYFRKLNRFIDFHELPEFLYDSIINESNKIKFIF